MKDDGGAELRTERGHRLADDVTRLCAVVVAAVGRHVQPRGQEACQLLAPQVRDGEVDPDLAQPGAGRRGRRVAVAGAVRPHEGLLCEVLGRGRVQHDGADRPEDGEVLLVVQLLELGGGIQLFAVGHTLSVRPMNGVDAEISGRAKLRNSARLAPAVRLTRPNSARLAPAAHKRIAGRSRGETLSGGRPGTRTRMGYPTRPSHVRVYQFRQPPGCSRMILPGGRRYCLPCGMNSPLRPVSRAFSMCLG